MPKVVTQLARLLKGRFFDWEEIKVVAFYATGYESREMIRGQLLFLWIERG